MKSVIKKLSLLAISILTVTSLNAANLVVGGNKNATKIDNKNSKQAEPANS